jgi:purine-cytosine permease-like protein
MVLNGTVGARLHISFPVLNRSSFGFWFSYFSVVSRVVLAMFWFGIQVPVLCCLSEAKPDDASNFRHTPAPSVSTRC